MPPQNASKCLLGRIANFSVGRILLLLVPVTAASLIAGIGIYVAQRGGYYSMLIFLTCLPGSIVCGVLLAAVVIEAIEIKSNAIRWLIWVLEFAAIVTAVVVLMPPER